MHKGYCKICEHKKLADINKMILDDATNISIVKLFGLNNRTLKKHKENCLLKAVEGNEKAKELFLSNILLRNVEDKLELLDKIIYGCSDYLTDPDNPDKFFMGARSTEIDVVYQEVSEKTGRLNQTQKKAKLQALLNVVESTDQFIVNNTSVKHSDPRDLLIKGVSELKQVTKMLIETTQAVIENEHKKRALDKVASDGGSISFEKQMQTITERLTIAYKKSDTEVLSDLAGLPELEEL